MTPYVEILPKQVDNAVGPPEHSRAHKEPPKEPEETLNGKMDYLRMFKDKDLKVNYEEGCGSEKGAPS